jgi:hypothetical protein
MTDRSRRRAAASDSSSREDNPFAAPPEGPPDTPWPPRRGADSEQGSGSGTGTDTGTGRGTGTSGTDERDGADGGDGSGSGSGSGGRQSSWGSQWSSRQPGRQSGGFGGGGGNGNGGGGNGQSGGSGGNGTGTGGSTRGLRWDPTDPLQRHARYSLHTGIWALFFSLFSLPEVALLLGALSLYWGINALRGGKSPSRSESSGRRGRQGRRGRGGSGAGATAEDVAGTDRTTAGADRPRPAPAIPVGVTPAQAAKSRTTAAISGLITASLALAIVAATFTFQAVYREYFTCTQDALTQSSREECKELLPSQLRPLLENR